MYNGHRNYNAWNVSLWINNDEFLYNTAKACSVGFGSRDKGAQYMIDNLYEMGITHTPDGVPYTKTNIKLAMVGM